MEEMVKHTFLCLIVLTLPFSIMASTDIAWDADSDPAIMNRYFIKKFTSLPLEGRVRDRETFWSGDYWPLNRGIINYRWYAKRKIGFNLDSPTKEEARRMTIPQLAELSPSEKYDLYIGRYDYPLKNEVSRLANPSALNWEGICHGFSPASMNHKEPRPKIIRNPDGIDIPFGSSDIKALLSYYYAHSYSAPDTHQMGKRCFKGQYLNRDRDCYEDMNAGAFHIVLGNRIGLEGKGFIADLQRYKEVWNHPVYAYKSQLLRELEPNRNSAPGTVKMLEIKTTITYVSDNGHDWHPVIGTRKQFYEKMNFHYFLDINADGEIIGGEWISRDRPDFLWIMGKPRKFEGILSKLGDLLNDD